MTLLYDGTAQGFLSLVHTVYTQKLHVRAIQKAPHVAKLFEEVVEIQSDAAKSQKVLSALQTKFAQKHFATITNMFLCDNSEFEMALLDFIKLGFRDQRNLDNINIPCVQFVQRLEKELRSVVHKMTGFTRFEELADGSLYAKIDTKFNVLHYLGKHFAKRFKTEDFIIHDIKRELALLSHRGNLSVEQVAFFDTPTLCEREEKFKKLWKTFFERVSIEKRKNKKLQQQLVPLHYRTYMSEFEG